MRLGGRSLGRGGLRVAGHGLRIDCAHRFAAQPEPLRGAEHAQPKQFLAAQAIEFGRGAVGVDVFERFRVGQQDRNVVVR